MAQHNYAGGRVGPPRPGAAGPPDAPCRAGAGGHGVPACGSWVCQQGKELWKEESRWHSIKGEVKDTDRIFSEAIQRGELQPPGGTVKDCVHWTANEDSCGGK